MVENRRKSLRLPAFDYSQPGAYFVTMVTHQRRLLFGAIEGEHVKLSALGRIVDKCWREVPEHFALVELGAHVVMPNHLHGIIVIHETVGARHASPLRHWDGVAPRSLGAMVGSFKSAVTRIKRRSDETVEIWQRGYYDHVIRNEKDLQNKTNYIQARPL